MALLQSYLWLLASHFLFIYPSQPLFLSQLSFIQPRTITLVFSLFFSFLSSPLSLYHRRSSFLSASSFFFILLCLSNAFLTSTNGSLQHFSRSLCHTHLLWRDARPRLILSRFPLSLFHLGYIYRLCLCSAIGSSIPCLGGAARHCHSHGRLHPRMQPNRSFSRSRTL